MRFNALPGRSLNVPGWLSRDLAAVVRLLLLSMSPEVYMGVRETIMLSLHSQLDRDNFVFFGRPALLYLVAGYKHEP